jgi:hypothetical protein
MEIRPGITDCRTRREQSVAPLQNRKNRV